MKFYPLTIKSIRKETENTVSISFDIPNEFTEKFKFKHGQYLTLKKNIDNEKIQRSYSICSSTIEDELRVAVKKIPNGKFSTFANEQLKVGDILESMPPMGNFTNKIDENSNKRYVAFAAGSGITPIMSIMKTILAKELNAEFTLFYGNKNTSSIIFKEELEDLKNIYMNRLSIFHILSKEDQGIENFNGRIDSEKTKFFIDKIFNVDSIDDVFICGPHEMIIAVSDQLKKHKIKEKNIHFELFNISKNVLLEKDVNEEKSKHIDESTIIVQIDNKKTKYKHHGKNKTILESAIDEGIDVPFACKSAVCMTCRSKIIKGKVKMELNYSLTNEEIEQGYVLACQSYPITSELEISFDK